METMLKSLAEVAAHKRTPFHLFVILTVTSDGNNKLLPSPSNLLLQPYCAIYNTNYGRGWPKRWQKNIDWNIIRQQIHIHVAGGWFWFREGKLKSFHMVCCWAIHYSNSGMVLLPNFLAFHHPFYIFIGRLSLFSQQSLTFCDVEYLLGSVKSHYSVVGL